MKGGIDGWMDGWMGGRREGGKEECEVGLRVRLSPRFSLALSLSKSCRATMSADTALTAPSLPLALDGSIVCDARHLCRIGRTDEDAHNSFCDEVGNWESGGGERGGLSRVRRVVCVPLTVAIEWVPIPMPKKAALMIL